jgi:hypothetical protein
MLQEPPTYIKALGVVGAPIKYKWSSDIATDRYDGEENDRLYDAIDASSYRAKMAISAVLAEFVVWRFHGHTDITDGLLRVEAAWASVIHPLYCEDLDMDLKNWNDAQKVQAPLELGLTLLGEASADYVQGNIYLAESVMKQAQLARYLIAPKKEFDAWLSDTLRRAAKTFPRAATYDERTEVYDASSEKPVPREFFEPSFRYTEAAAAKVLTAFLLGLDPKQNPYLRKSADMKARGFKGKPYSL